MFFFFLVALAKCGQYNWLGWDFPNDQIETLNMQIYNRATMASQLWDSLGPVSQDFVVPFVNQWPIVPKVFFSITQLTEDGLQGNTINYKVSITDTTISQTGFTATIKKDNHRLYKTSIMYFAYIDPQIDHAFFTITAADTPTTSVFRGQATYIFTKTIIFSQTFLSIPNVIVAWHGYNYDPIQGNTNTNGLWFRFKVVDGSITTTGFKAYCELLTINVKNPECYGGYLVVSLQGDNLKYQAIDYGYNEQQSDVGIKYFSFFTPPLQTNDTDLTPSIFYGFSGFQGPMNGIGECDQLYTAVYSVINFDPVTSCFRFQISGNPSDCFHQIMYRVSATYMLFKKKQCPSILFQFAGNFTYCQCLPGYYEAISSNIDQCYLCDISCLTCNNPTPSDCTQCKNNMDLQLTLGQIQGTCGCNSPSIFVLPLSTYKCQYCSLKCALCIGNAPTDCYQCYNNMTLSVVNPLNVPPNGYCSCNQQIEKDLRCFGCHYACALCSGTEWNQCTTCQTTRTQFSQGLLYSCPCSTGYYETYTSQCGSCDPDCSTCSGQNKTDCLKCKFQQLNLQILNTYEGSGECGCNDGYWRNNQTCSPCDVRCAICANAQQCYRCTSDYVFQATLQQIYGICLCKDGYFQGIQNCVACSTPCQTCTSSLLCLSCLDGMILNNQGTCDCQTKFYQSQPGVCVKCPKPCDLCDSNKCLSCVGTAQPKPQGFDCSCPGGQYLNYVSCLPCDPTCQTCFGGHASQCLSCYDSQPRQLQNGRCQCEQQFYELDNQCLQCQYPCQTCLSVGQTIQCLSCSFDAQTRSLANNCACMEGYYETGLVCLICSEQCLTCTASANTCIMCKYLYTQPAPICLCDNDLQLINNQCLLGKNLTLFTYFNQYNSLQYLRIESPDLLFFQDSSRKLHQGKSQSQLLTLDNVGQTFDLSVNLKCPFIWNPVSIVHNVKTSIVLQANYTTNNFIATNLSFKILRPNTITNNKSQPIHIRYAQGLNAYVGPYQYGGVDDDGLIGYSALSLFTSVMDTIDQADLLHTLRKTRLVSLLLPTFWGIALIVEGCQLIPPLVYMPISLATGFLIKPPPLYSLQYPYTTEDQNNSFSSTLHSPKYFLDANVTTTVQSISPNLFRMNYTGIFIVDASDSLVFIGITEVLHWAASSVGSPQRAKMNTNILSNFLRLTRQQFYRVETYHLLKLALLGFNNLPAQSNLFEVTSVIISIFIVFILLKEIVKAALYCTHFLLIMTIKSKSQPNRYVKFLGYQLHYDDEDTAMSNVEDKYLHGNSDTDKRPLDYLPYNIDISTDNGKCHRYHSLVMMKRILIGIIVGAGAQEQPLLITIMVIETIYILFKIYCRPYRSIWYFLKIVGDLAYLIAIALLAFPLQVNECQPQFQTIPLIILMCLGIFVSCYLLASLIPFFIYICATKKTIEMPETIIEYGIEIEMPTYESVKVKKPQILELKPQETFFNLTKGKLFSYSKLFNKGILLNSNSLKISWKSEMIMAPDELDSCGTRYSIGFLNKTQDKDIKIENSCLRHQKFDLVVGQTIIEIDELKPQQSQIIESECMMDLATLDIYDDRLILEGTWRVLGGDRSYKMDFGLCSSELKIIQNMAVNTEELTANATNMFMTYEYADFDYDPKLFDLMSHNYSFVSQGEGNYIAKMCTYFHKYPRLYFYLEIVLDLPMVKGSLKIIANQFDQGLITDSGYQNVIEYFGMAVVDFLSVEKLMKDNIQ